MAYSPDRWVVLEVNGPKGRHYRVLGGWLGGYLHGDSWRLNSGITKHEFDGDYWYFYGSSGSCYECYLDSYGFTSMTSSIYNQLKDKYKENVLLLRDQEWVQKDWSWDG